MEVAVLLCRLSIGPTSGFLSLTCASEITSKINPTSHELVLGPLNKETSQGLSTEA